MEFLQGDVIVLSTGLRQDEVIEVSTEQGFFSFYRAMQYKFLQGEVIVVSTVYFKANWSCRINRRTRLPYEE